MKVKSTAVKRQTSKPVDLPPIYEKSEMPSHRESLSEDDFDLPQDQEVPGPFDSGEFKFSLWRTLLYIHALV